MMGSSKRLKVSEALELLKSGESMEGFTIDFSGSKIKALDAFRLGKAGIEVPDEVIEYDDADIAYDPEFDEYRWERTNEDPLPSHKAKFSVHLEIDQEVNAWIQKKGINLSHLLEKLVQDFYSSNQMIREEK